MKSARLLCLPLLATLGACGGNADDAERKTAAGEVLGGTISDDMLPLDTVTSQSPPLREKAKGDSGTGSGGGGQGPPADEPAPAEDGAEPEPTASAAPTPEASPDE